MSWKRWNKCSSWSWSTQLYTLHMSDEAFKTAVVVFSVSSFLRWSPCRFARRVKRMPGPVCRNAPEPAVSGRLQASCAHWMFPQCECACCGCTEQQMCEDGYGDHVLLSARLPPAEQLVQALWSSTVQGFNCNPILSIDRVACVCVCFIAWFVLYLSFFVFW